MKSWFRVAAVVAVLAPVAGCTFYFGDDDPCDDPVYTDGFAAGLVDPYTGNCTYSYTGGGCDDGSPRPLAEGQAADQALQDWATCPSQCTGLDENSCLTTSGCRAGYEDDGNDDGVNRFFECFATPPSGPVQGTCEGLDAYECSRHDDCASVYTPYGWAKDVAEQAPEAPPRQFLFCQAEVPTPPQGCYSNEDCGPGYDCTADTECMLPPGCEAGMDCPAVCYGQCIPTGNQCAEVDCGPGYRCEEWCDGGQPVPFGGEGDSFGIPCLDENQDGVCDEGTCYAQCVPDTQPSCEVVLCEGGTHCEEICYGGGCDPNGVCTDEIYCEVQCVPDEQRSCENVDCGIGYECQEVCAPCDPTMGGENCGYCYPQCVPTNPINCEAALCEGGTHCEERCYQPPCLPDGECPPPFCESACVPDGGRCDGLVACDALPPSCPEGTIPEVINLCWSGQCIPTWECETTICEEIQTEDQCVNTLGCGPLYDGENCTCYPDGSCSCEVLTFASCQTQFWMGGGPSPGARAAGVPAVRQSVRKDQLRSQH